MKNKEAKIFFSLIITVAILFVIVVIFGDKVNESAVPAAAETTQTTQPPKQEVSVNFISAGDNLIHDGIYKQAAKRAGGTGAYDFSYCYENVAEIVSKADVATINQETVIAKSFDPSGYPTFNSPHEVGDEIVKIGFDVINLANNHMLDKGAKGMRENVEYWDSQTSVTHTGSYKNEEDVNRVEYIESNGMKIGLVGITQYTNGLYLPKDSELRIIYSDNEELIQKKITEAKKECDIVLVNVHWGIEYQTSPNDDQRALAKKMSDWGADVIIGHHPHVLEPIEFIERDDGSRTLVVYSLGNFISQQNKPSRVIGGMVQYTVTKDKTSGRVTVSNVKFVPTITHYVQGVDDVKIYLLSQYTDALAAKQRNRLGSQKFSLDYINSFLSDVIDSQFYDTGIQKASEENTTKEVSTAKETTTVKETTTAKKSQTSTTKKAAETTTEKAAESTSKAPEESTTAKKAA